MRGGASSNLFTFFLFCLTSLALSSDTLTPSQSLPTNQTLLSPNAIFELGFFSYTNTTWYLGIWYKTTHNTDKTIVWVANRDTPLRNNIGFLKIANKGNLVIVNQSQKPVWSTNETGASDPVLQLLDSGNLILKEANQKDPTKPLWQSFDHPTDTLLPGMKLGWNLDTGVEKHMSSWRVTNEDPSSGDFSFKLDYQGLPEIFLWNKNQRIYRSGPWNGERFSGVPEMQPVTDSIKFTFFEDQHQVYYTFSIGNQSLFSRLSVTSDGELQRLTWIESRQAWNKFWYARKDQCDSYRECGPYGICDTNASPVCQCVRGFRPRNQPAWNLRDGSDGCVRDTALACGGDGFLRLKNVKLPETTTAVVNRSMGLAACGELCGGNCSCTGYANVDIRNGGSGCVMWVGQLLDIRRYPAGGQDLYVRLAAKDLGDLGVEGGSHKTSDTVKKVGIIVGVAAFILLACCIYILWKKRKLQCILKGKTEHRGFSERSQDLLMNERVFSSTREQSRENNLDDLELPFFDFNTITMATNNFSEENKLGQGGFGIVYKGRLMEGQDIAVKRLSKTSGQGIEEFKNEVKLIVKLQHRNLVRLLGCSIQVDEKMLVYEYMENRSLDAILFDKAKRSSLDWHRRFNIICGIARGLLYLHQDSRFRIIHRDLKASNILLDKEMNPKISDFGMARIFGTDQTEANTVRVVGTYGYMSPEYAMDGIFSIKSDVFSFGVLVLEIISGKKNRGFYYANKELNLLGHAWRVWKEGNALELIDSSIDNSYSPSEVHRCIQVGLLCVQERAEDRPTMSSVVLMLSSDTASMPEPKNPGFCLGRNPLETDSSSSKQDESCTVNHVTVTMLDAR
ncbi:receptor-like serine/threonine-protein kinase SD1-8 [Cajanus cajan]|uniref:Receptor-like serine/threonine-protein kinase n=1 Tax=Cajanus cajan TaxID=3821 RepID=A0A151RE53_CAJCA|nr:receptor-like serine/threonine-protein kinase SD1-8 [Cajanus cajan]KYP40811.1 Putative serine/threonine-protein kinase receptor [Cajanus cajan]